MDNKDLTDIVEEGCTGSNYERDDDRLVLHKGVNESMLGYYCMDCTSASWGIIDFVLKCLCFENYITVAIDALVLYAL